ncbi:MAG: hypothetical protein HQL56_01110 [Magnetococcales bacterium]|nr:hypothetical protein [Magnetococcales bacterium]
MAVIQIDQSDVEQIRAILSGMGSAVQFGTKVAINKTAYEVRSAERAEMQRVFDRPIRYTLNSLKVQTASSQNGMEASDWFKKPADSGAERKSHYLEPQVFGGPRRDKASERLLKIKGVLPINQQWVPTPATKYDSAGNPNKGQIQQILSGLQAFLEINAQQNATARSRRRNRVRREVSVAKDQRGNPYGIRFNGRLVYYFVKPKYPKRFKFYEVGEHKAHEILPGLLQSEIRRSIARYAARHGGNMRPSRGLLARFG